MEKTLKAFEASLNEVIEKVENFKERLDLEKIDNSIIDMGVSLYRLKLYEDSLPCFHLGLDIKKKLSSKETLETALKSHWTGTSYEKLAKYDEAIKHYNEALLIYMRVMSNSDHYKSDVLNDIAECLYHQKKYDEALKVFNESIEFRKRVLDYNENVKGKSLYNIGLIYKDQEKYAEALGYFNRSLEIYERIKLSLGDKIPEEEIGDLDENIFDALHYVGEMHYHLDDCEKALGYLTKALESANKLERKKVSDIKSIRNFIGLAYKKLGNFQEALKYLHDDNETKECEPETEKKHDLSESEPKKKDENENIGESQEDDGFSLVEAMKETDTIDSKQN